MVNNFNQVFSFLKCYWAVPVFLLPLGLFTACSASLPPEVVAAMEELPAELDFNLHIKPILSDRCFACHGPDEAKRKAGLRLDLAEAAYAEIPESPGKYAIRPGKTGSSQLVSRILTDDPELVMPPPESELHLSARDKALLLRWVEEGAVYRPHWAFIPAGDPEPPQVKHEDRVINPVDRFILRKIEQQGWEPSAPADKSMLLRRLSFDLSGLPPTLDMIDSFLADPSPAAYEKAVDRLLASPQYGERMATDWMDVSRFADTHGYTVDRFRDMSPWRDWVIKAFNDNMPYDRFITWQLAGDLLPNPTREQLLATGFNRNHQQNMEGGIVEEEFRVEYVADRTNTLGKAFLGLTLECARCHDHKYDPISQKNYYELYSFFNNVQEAGQISWDNALPVPTMLLSDEKVEEVAAFLRRQIAEKEEVIAALQPETATLGAPGAFAKGLIAHYDLDVLPVRNRLAPAQLGSMKQQDVSTPLEAVLQDGHSGKGLLLDGDAWLDLDDVGAFERHQPFSVGIWVNLPAELENGVIFHKSTGAALYNWRGYHLAIKNNRLQLLMAHTAPYNAIISYADDVPREQWIQLTMTYDGSSKAAGLKVYLNGRELPTTIESDNLYKSILFGFGGQEVGLQIGARWRGIGIKGAVVDDITVFNRELCALEVKSLAGQVDLPKVLAASPAGRSADEQQLLDQYRLHLSPAYNKGIQELTRLREQLNHSLDTVREIMIMQEMAEPRPTYVLKRGQYDVYGEQVFPATPEQLLVLPDSLPRNRLGLAQWLFLPENPLTARVAVNRLWQQFFGRGLVATAEDFGNQGQLPSHPELLDWLAREYIRLGWDTKQMVKLIVLSGTYRQSSKTSEAVKAADPNNIYLARGPSARLSAEMLRDNALAAAGLLVKDIGGPSVKPYQPDGLWRINGGNYNEDVGDKRYRRSLYTFWKRTIPHPTQATFDAPSRDNCTVRRQKTSTPLQALVLLNDPVYVEAAKVMGEGMARQEDPALALTDTFRKLTGREPSAQELSLLAELQQQEQEKFRQHPEKISGWLGTGAHVVDKGLDLACVAANTVVASTIINADATIVKR